MINKIFTRFSILIAFAFLFSSCGSVSIRQKRYSNGLNISWFGGKDEARPKTVKVSVRNSNEPGKLEKVDNPVVYGVAQVAEEEDLQNNDAVETVESTLTATSNEVAAVQAVQTGSKKAGKRALKAAVKDIKTQIHSVVNQEQLSPTAINQTHGDGLAGWGKFLLYLGFIVFLFIRVLGLLIMLVGLIFILID